MEALDEAASLSGAEHSSNPAGASLDTVSYSNDFQKTAVNIYDIPQNKVTLNEIKPIGSADNAYFAENERVLSVLDDVQNPVQDA